MKRGVSIAVNFGHLRDEWHPTKNGALKFEEIAARSGKYRWWICKEGHEWEMAISSRTGYVSQGCPYCSGRRTSIVNSVLTTHPFLQNEWHPIKNGNVQFQDVSYGSDKRVWWVCKEGHEWVAVVKNRTIQKQNCPFCSGGKVSKNNSLDILYPSLTPDWHPTKNGNVRFQDVSYGSKKRVWWKCRLGHEWETPISYRTAEKASGCPYCSGNKVSDKNSLNITNPQLKKDWHPTKNGNVRFQDVSYGSKKRVWWVCKNGHEWEATPNNRTAGTCGCPRCSNLHSKAEMEIFKIVQFSYPDAISGKRRLLKNKRFELDIWIPSLRKAIEYNGQWCHTKPDQLERDARKKKECIEAGVRLLTVTDTEYLADKETTVAKILAFLAAP